MNKQSNDYGVKANVKYKTYRKKYFSSSDGCYGESFVNSYATLNVTYPKGYKNLCIGIGGSTEKEATYEDEYYYDGDADF